MQERAWDNEYKEGKLLTLKDEPTQAVKDFLRWLRRDEHIDLEGLTVLDLGAGTGRNGNYIAELGNEVVGLEISDTALTLARSRASEKKLNATYIKQSMGISYPFTDEKFDLALDVTSSNSLLEAERIVYLKETHRVLKPGAYFFVRTLCKDGDQNAKNLLKLSPGPERDMYEMPELGIIEHVWSKEDFIRAYSDFFTIIRLERTTSYTRLNNRSYKRNFWVVYLKKK